MEIDKRENRNDESNSVEDESESSLNEKLSSTENLNLQIERKEHEIETIDEWEYTSNEEFKSIQINDLNVELIGFVSKINSPKIVGYKTKHRLMTFIINNDEGTQCMILAWKNEIKKIESLLELHNVIRIQGAKAVEIKYPKFNTGNTDYELVFQKCTTINILKQEKDDLNFKSPNPVLKTISLFDLKLEHGNVKIEGYVRTAFRLLDYLINDEKVSYGIGSVTDGELKIDIRINNFPKVEQLYEKGDHISVTGYIKNTYQGLVFILTENENCINLIDDKKLKFEETFFGFKPVLKQINKY